MAYSTAALIRSLENAFDDATDFTEAVLLGWSTNFADPEIDARLLAAGFTTPITSTVPTLVKSVATMLAAAHGLNSFVGARTFASVERADALRKSALEILEFIAEGTYDVGLTRSDAGRPIDVDDDPETFHARAVIVGDEWQWERYAEDRES